MVMITTKESDWGTWEELLLGGAILRHGTDNWTVVADELRSHSHSLYPQILTAQICEAKYEDLRERYNMTFKAWFEELKKKRVSELKAALLKSQDSIGSLESKLQSLKSESNEKYDSSRTVSLEPCQKSEGGECTSKDTSKDLSSAGSFTQQELTTKWSPEEIKPEPEPEPLAIEHEKHLYGDIFESMYGGHVLPSMRKKRGKRKRKDCSISNGKDVTEVSAVESNLMDSCVDIGSISSNNQNRGHDIVVPKELTKIYNTVAQNDCALVFRRRLDSQKRGRYKKLVRRHMDFDTIQSRINNCSISSVKELFRDLLLVANNAALFYSKNTREHKSAVSLRDIVTKSLKHYLTEGHKEVPATTSPVQTSLTAKKQRTGTNSLKTGQQRTETDSVKTGQQRTGTNSVKTGQRNTATVLQDVVVKSSLSGGKRKVMTDSPAAVKKSLGAGKKGVAAGRRVENRQTNRGVDCSASSGRKRKQVR